MEFACNGFATTSQVLEAHACPELWPHWEPPPPVDHDWHCASLDCLAGLTLALIAPIQSFRHCQVAIHSTIPASQHPAFHLSIHPLIHSTSWAIFGIKNDATRRVLIASPVGISVACRLHGRVNALRVGCSRIEQLHSFSCSISSAQWESSSIPLLSPTLGHFGEFGNSVGDISAFSTLSFRWASTTELSYKSFAECPYDINVLS